jgi:iron complex outermembrane receptor protein
MFRSILLRGVSAGAMTLVLFPSSTLAQEALPTIDVGGAQPTTSAGARPASPGEPQTPAQGYVVTNATTGTKTDVPLKETPVSVAVVPKQVIEDQAITRLQEALENVSGVQNSSNDFEGYVFRIRGFPSYDVYRNGLLVPGGEANPTVYETANLERVEVLKGPSSILYGRAEPGGLINLVTKKPLDAPRYSIQQEIGSYDHYRTQWDFTAPVKQVDGLSYRFSGAYQNEGSFRKFQGGERAIIAPVITYRPSTWTEFTLDMQYLHEKQQSEAGFPVLGSAPAPIPLSRSFQEANDPRDKLEGYIVSYAFKQKLAENWTLSNRFHYSENWISKLNLTPNAGDLAPDGATLVRSAQFQDLKGYTYATNIDLEGKFDALFGKHDFLMGLDYLNSYYDYAFSQSNFNYPINIYAPVYGTVPNYAYVDALNGASVSGGFVGFSSVLTRQKGLYVQDHVTWFDKLHLLIGARYDNANVVQGRGNISKQDAINARLRAAQANDDGWSPRVGVLYDLTKELSAYAAYSRSFGTSNGFTDTNAYLPPQRGVQWEVGLKAQILTDLSATLAFYQLTKSDLTTHDFASPDPQAVKLAGLQRSRGVELDVIGRVTDRLSLIANYAYTDAKVIADNPRDPTNPYGSGLFLNHLDNVPRHSGKIFLTYDFGANGLGWRVGGGVKAQTHSWGDIQNTFIIPGWARLDGFASYTTLYEGHKLTAQLNLENINNVRYFTGADVYFNSPARLGLFPGKPFTATGTLKVEF